MSACDCDRCDGRTYAVTPQRGPHFTECACPCHGVTPPPLFDDLDFYDTHCPTCDALSPMHAPDCAVPGPGRTAA